MDVQKVSGVGPKAAERLTEANITTVDDLANSKVADLVEVGFTEKTAEKYITAAQLLVSSQPAEVKEEKPKAKKEIKPKKEEPVAEPAEVKEEKPKAKKEKKPKKEEPVAEPAEVKEEKPKAKKEEKPKAKKEKTPKKTTEREDQRSPMPKGIPTKKKRGVQTRTTHEDAEFVRTEKKEGWAITARELSAEEKEEKRLRLEMMSAKAKITREIPTKFEPTKAKKKGKKSKTERPVKLEKETKEVEKKKKQVKKVIEYYSPELYPTKVGERRRGTTAKSSGQTKPRAELERGTVVGELSSHRRSRRVLHTQQVIVNLDEDLDAHPDSLVGQKVYFMYPDTSVRVAGSVSKRFGQKKSRKVLVNFKKGIRQEGLHQKIFIK